MALFALIYDYFQLIFICNMGMISFINSFYLSKQAIIMKNKIFALFAFTAITLVTPYALAQDTMEYDKDFSRLYFAVGDYGAFDDDNSIDLRIEYRPASVVFIDNVKPWFGAEITTEGSIWAGGGLLYDWNFADDWHATPSVGAGLYHHGSGDTDLDNTIQFRSQLEISYEFDNDLRVGGYISHLSNGGLGDSNPGTEVIGLSWSVPF